MIDAMPSKIQIPQHVGIIMDGNRRWAREQGKPSFEGHARGYTRAIEVARHAFNTGVKYITLYAFSSENWNRAQEEIGYLMSLLSRMLKEQQQELRKNGIRLKFIGASDRIDNSLVSAMREAERACEQGTNGTLLIAFNYGGRREITDAVQKLLKKTRRTEEITEADVSSQLNTAGVPDPDLIIRTAGERRLSGFLLWQAAYSELYFTETLWPAFTTKDFDAALDDFALRKRNFGK
ncbi:MAG: di-trans,poly-cis-decaprenylcistransferase [Candidatus Komeilibacteria bacterium RIFCSPHIGHO2_01_FULL_52_14]|uniref:Isoprenyl transferase n=1 Tax=Candidatus Komeilibacteria bacterium RIFCSPHIGHO2_01_FULL_52_14 TaxID=1798549 RepID=A0A1G2BM40_9BACT|nr:MAG: di-trans,poly-cis-decaprenylcistransferase [Candidatus Komeilibacteria bacterium RIFCSPHIGHO2_01_FULL_52_14]